MNQSELIWRLKFENHNLNAELDSFKNGNTNLYERVSDIFDRKRYRKKCRKDDKEKADAS